ncbi:MAG: hypothetical protein ACRCVX_12510 [Shewanella sp.]
MSFERAKKLQMASARVHKHLGKGDVEKAKKAHSDLCEALCDAAKEAEAAGILTSSQRAEVVAPKEKPD